MSDIELFQAFVDSFRKKIEQIAARKEKERQESYWRALSPYDFEQEVGNWYISKGYNAKVTQQAKDGGVDIVLTKDDVLTYVQCKHYKNKIGVVECRELGGVMLPNKVKNGVIVTLQGVTRQGKIYCQQTNIKIVTLHTLLRSNRDMYFDLLQSTQKPTLPFSSNLPTPFEEREVYGYYIYGNVFASFEETLKELRNIPIANLTNMYDTKAIIKYRDHLYIIYSTAEKIKWLGNYVYRYLDAKSGELVSPRSLQ